MAAPLRISNRDARRLFLDLQGLARPPRQKLGPDSLHDLVRQLGFVQLDSINAVEHLHEERGDLFEHWTHDASIIPTEFYPHWRHRFAQVRKQLPNPRWKQRLGPDGPKLVRAVKKRIEREGPLMSRDFEDKGKGAWWGWGPSKTALEYLWRTGDLAIARREGFQKVYDLTERVIPDLHRAAAPSLKETVDWKCREALARLGVATTGEIAAFWASVSPKQAADWAKPRIGTELIEVEIAGGKTGNNGSKPRTALAFADIEDRLAAAAAAPKKLRFLSPFDPVIRDRKRTERLFGFDYRIEVFVPEKKRQYGYYVLPVLEGDRFTGRADMKVHRKDGRLELKGLWLEKNVRLTPAREESLRKALARLGRFTGAATIDADAALRRTKAG